jgi:hypothetical protein
MIVNTPWLHVPNLIAAGELRKVELNRFTVHYCDFGNRPHLIATHD